MASEFDKTLEDVAREIAVEIFSATIKETRSMEEIAYDGLKHRLLELLEAGEKCRLVCTNREVAYEYDAAKLKAMQP